MSNITFTLKVESAGGNAGNFARISINGTDIGLNYGRGLNVAVFDQTTGQVLSKANFDTFLPGNAPRFADFIKSVPTGQIVAVAVKDDAIANLYTEAYDAVVQAFLSIGSTKFGDLSFQGSWALIGQKGGFADATEELSPNSPVTVTRSFSPTSPPPITPPPQPIIPPGSQPPIPITQTRWLEIQRVFESNPDWSSQFGRSTATSGQWLIVGAPYHERAFVGDGGVDFGAALIFQLQNDGSWLQTQKLQPPQLKLGNRFGQSVDIDGEWAIVGTPYSDVVKPDGGAAYIFHLENGQWVQKDTLAPTDLKASDLFGYSVSIDGDWAIVGAHLTEATNAGDGGAAYIFHLENGVWVQKPRLQPLELKTSDWFGQSVAINGEWAFVGAVLADTSPGIVDTGAVYVFHLENGVWVQKPKLQPPDLNAADWFGTAVTINGNRAVVGAKGLEGIRWDNSGGAYIFQLENGEWKQEYKFVADRDAGEYTTGYDIYDGRSVALTSWGVAFLGAPLTIYRTNTSTYGGKGALLYYGSVYAIGQR
jgi:hypothetical protein